ncbi:phage holin family protein [Oceanimonas pelagia]|uniref:Phage holin family protein n=1 Tax=Oceanimonas pelagia TaxID=3028314 RepID=A0AA50KJQ7_9GAMM|nr:phage holin family protein [Oceanimonas pelagia]WMC09421.1 phage holin family protein [Oceanimonas pelagia]
MPWALPPWWGWWWVRCCAGAVNGMAGKTPLRELLDTLIELLFVRLRMARIEFIAQKERMVRLGVLALVAGALFFMAFISLLFGLNEVLSPAARVWVFFGLALGLLLGMLWACLAMMKNLAGQRRFLEQTLKEVQEDLAYLRGRRDMSDWSMKD